MPTAVVNGVRLFYALTGESGPPLVLVHGSWGDHRGWDQVAPALAVGCRVLVYDRRGHSQSERLTVHEPPLFSLIGAAPHTTIRPSGSSPRPKDDAHGR